MIGYSAIGRGPTLLMCPGGDGAPDGVAALGAQLADAWTVVTYRRGARSTIAEHAADAADVLDQLAAGPVAVFGSSFGGLVALELVLSRPGAVSTLVVHEPPLLAVLPADDPARDQMHAMHTAAAADMRSAGPLVMTTTGTRMDEWEDAPPAVAPDPGRLAVLQRFFAEVAPAAEHYAPDPAAIRAAAATTRIVPAVGTTATGHFPYRCAEALAALLGVPVAQLPGAHTGMVTHPRTFAAALRELLIDQP